MWSLGCIAVELFLGLPLWPGTSEYNQMGKIVESLGVPPKDMLVKGKWTEKFFVVSKEEDGSCSYQVKIVGGVCRVKTFCGKLLQS